MMKAPGSFRLCDDNPGEKKVEVFCYRSNSMSKDMIVADNNSYFWTESYLMLHQQLKNIVIFTTCKNTRQVSGDHANDNQPHRGF